SIIAKPHPPVLTKKKPDGRNPVGKLKGIRDGRCHPRRIRRAPGPASSAFQSGIGGGARCDHIRCTSSGCPCPSGSPSKHWCRRDAAFSSPQCHPDQRPFVAPMITLPLACLSL